MAWTADRKNSDFFIDDGKERPVDSAVRRFEESLMNFGSNVFVLRRQPATVGLLLEPFDHVVVSVESPRRPTS